MPTSHGVRRRDRRVVLSTVWIVTMFNYLYTDLAMVMFQPGVYQKAAGGMTGGAMLGWTVFVETAMAMILLSRLLPQRINRWANVGVGALQMAGLCWKLSNGIPALFYLFTAFIEIGCTAFIVSYAWTWRRQAAD